MTEAVEVFDNEADQGAKEEELLREPLRAGGSRTQQDRKNRWSRIKSLRQVQARFKSIKRNSTLNSDKM